LFHPFVFWLVNEKKNWHFCLFKIATQGVSLWHSLVYVCIYILLNLHWFTSSIFLLSTLVPCLQ
jgi:hypothetical protein